MATTIWLSKLQCIIKLARNTNFHCVTVSTIYISTGSAVCLFLPMCHEILNKLQRFFDHSAIPFLLPPTHMQLEGANPFQMSCLRSALSALSLYRSQNVLGKSKSKFYQNSILLPKLFWTTVRKNCSSDWEKLLDL